MGSLGMGSLVKASRELCRNPSRKSSNTHLVILPASQLVVYQLYHLLQLRSCISHYCIWSHISRTYSLWSGNRSTRTGVQRRLWWGAYQIIPVFLCYRWEPCAQTLCFLFPGDVVIGTWLSDIRGIGGRAGLIEYVLRGRFRIISVRPSQLLTTSLHTPNPRSLGRGHGLEKRPRDI